MFETGENTRKGRNIARDPRVALAVSVLEFDLTVKGEAIQVTDPEAVALETQGSGRATRWIF